MKHACLLVILSLLAVGLIYGQVTSGSILGSVQDPSGASVVNAKVTVRNVDTNASQSLTTSTDGRFRFPQLPVGSYELTVEAPGFAKFLQGPIVLRLNEEAEVPIKLSLAGVTESVNITSDAPLINTTTAEVGVNFDTKRIENLPLAPNHNVFNLALSVAGVSQLSGGNSSFADGGVSFSVNGARTRSNNFMIDGADINQPSITGATQRIENPDTVAEFRLITNQFQAEYGRTAGAVVNIITKRGTNAFHGTAYWSNNNNHFNSLSNLNKQAGFKSAPYRNENQFAGTLGGPIIKDKTFFFVSAMRWTDRQLGSGSSISAAPTAAGDALLQPLAATRPQLRALLTYLPPAQNATGKFVQVTENGQTLQIPVGILGGVAPNLLNDWQWSARGDHRFSDKESLAMRYQWDDRVNVSGQSVPPGLTSNQPERREIATTALNSSLSPNIFNELRLSFSRFLTQTSAADVSSQNIPSIEVSELGLTGFNASTSRTAIGLALNYPQSAAYNNYQLADTVSINRGPHSMKFGIDFQRQDQFTVFNPTLRGRLAYANLQGLVDDTAQVATINTPLPGIPTTQYYKYYNYFFFLQDEWRVKSNFTLTYGVRYETPGNAFDLLKSLNQQELARNGGNPAFAVNQLPGRDTNNWAPRVGFNYRVGEGPGFLHWLTGKDKLVVRGGYARSYDLIFNNIALNVFSAFPFTLVTTGVPNSSGLVPGAFALIDPIRAGTVVPPVKDPAHITRTIVDTNLHAPSSDQYAFQAERELSNNWAFTLGWIATKGTGLLDTLDGNPTIPGTKATQRVNPNLGIVRERANSGSSIYHSLQASLEKRLSRNFSMAAHYTWSMFIDDGSEVFNPSNSGEVAVAQDSFARRLDRGRSTYDRPQRFAVNGVYEIPFMHDQTGLIGHVLGGWQVSGFLTSQSGSPFSPLAGIDPGNVLTGIDGLVGLAVRPNILPGVNLSGVSINQIYRSGAAAYFSQVTAANPIGNAGRNILRTTPLNDLDFAVNKNFRMPWEGHSLSYRLELYNAFNHRNYGIPESRINSPAFANEGTAGTDSTLTLLNRRIVMGLRYQF
ncbi:MAG TPA: TonB-dependent receptor [Bryobacteraceae bacterium]|nr:TonB-dependent receptor [Bryobacteraceae bacterium]